MNAERARSAKAAMIQRAYFHGAAYRWVLRGVFEDVDLPLYLRRGLTERFDRAGYRAALAADPTRAAWGRDGKSLSTSDFDLRTGQP